MRKAVIYSYNGAGASMRHLSRFLDDAPILTRQNFTETELRDKVLINYGANYLTVWSSGWLNHPDKIRNAVDKLRTFDLCVRNNVPIPVFTHSKTVVKEWLQQGKQVYARATSTGSKGHGISILNTPHQSIPDAAFYSQALNHTYEYRVHVVNAQIISIGRKYAKESNANKWIRNMDNGWAFYLHVDAPIPVQQAGLQGVIATGLDFGAADVAYDRVENKAYVLEVNSAPTMSESTALRYAEAFRTYLGH
jgi:glutathione synthase/RimK-type ligase-like ATP-grasp enzyme